MSQLRSQYLSSSRKVRNLSQAEVTSIQASRNQCLPGTSWSDIKILVGSNFDAATHVQGCTFGGHCVLGDFTQSRGIDVKGVTLPCGVFRSTIVNCEVHDGARVSDSIIVSRCIIEAGASVIGCGSVTMVANPKSTFANGQTLSLVADSVNRKVKLHAEMTLEQAAYIAGNPQDTAFLRTWNDKVTVFAKSISSDHTIISEGAQVLNCLRIEDAFIGKGAKIEASTVIDSCILSCTVLGSEGTASGMSFVQGGCLVEHSILQWGCICDSMAIISHSFLCATSHVDCHAKVKQSIIGPCTSVSEGEVTSSLVGYV